MPFKKRGDLEISEVPPLRKSIISICWSL